MFPVWCHPEILLPWQRDVTTSPLCSLLLQEKGLREVAYLKWSNRRPLSHKLLFNNYSWSPNGLWINGLWGRSPKGLLTQRQIDSKPIEPIDSKAREAHLIDKARTLEPHGINRRPWWTQFVTFIFVVAYHFLFAMYSNLA